VFFSWQPEPSNGLRMRAACSTAYSRSGSTSQVRPLLPGREVRCFRIRGRSKREHGLAAGRRRGGHFAATALAARVRPSTSRGQVTGRRTLPRSGGRSPNRRAVPRSARIAARFALPPLGRRPRLGRAGPRRRVSLPRGGMAGRQSRCRLRRPTREPPRPPGERVDTAEAGVAEPSEGFFMRTRADLRRIEAPPPRAVIWSTR
jgi:hypothetical protein